MCKKLIKNKTQEDLDSNDGSDESESEIDLISTNRIQCSDSYALDFSNGRNCNNNNNNISSDKSNRGHVISDKLMQ